MPNFYQGSLYVMAVIPFVLGVGYAVGCLQISEHKHDSIYIHSRLRMSFAMILLSLGAMLHLQVSPRTIDNNVGTAITLTIYYLVSKYFGMAMLSLCNPQYAALWRRLTNIIKFLVITAVLGITFYFCSYTSFLITTKIVAAVFVIEMLHMVYKFCTYYMHLKEDLSNYYSDNYEAYLHWMPAGTFAAAVLGVLAPFFPFMSLTFITLYNLASALIFFYIFVCYERYAVFARYCTVVRDMEQEDEQLLAEQKHAIGAQNEQTPLQHNGQSASPNTDATHQPLPIDSLAPGSQSIEPPHVPVSSTDERKDYVMLPSAMVQLEQWIVDKGFRNSDITIQDLATLVGTNRTYLSKYINSRYQTTFRNWIALLRIDDAKEILLSSDSSILEISELLGFSSPTTFSRTFQQLTGLKPTDYRKLNAAQN